MHSGHCSKATAEGFFEEGIFVLSFEEYIELGKGRRRF